MVWLCVAVALAADGWMDCWLAGWLAGFSSPCLLSFPISKSCICMRVGANIPARFAAGDKLYNLQFPRRAIDREEEREKETLKV